jgi:DNA-binding LytR/AlgR family response regulator
MLVKTGIRPSWVLIIFHPGHMTPTLIFIRRNNRYHKLLVGDILFIRAHGSYLEIITRESKFSLALNLSQFIRKNPIHGLVRIHRSYIVNINALDSFDHEFAYVNQHQIPIGDAFREQFMDKLNSF